MSQVHLWGDSITERQARLILPILMRQALAGRAVTYGQIADELGIGHPYLGGHLGIIVDALNALSKQWDEEIPAIQALVLNKTTRLPGDSFGYGVPRLAGYKAWSPEEKRLAVARESAGVFAYKRWPDVLAALRLSPAEPVAPPGLLAAAARGADEGDAHRRLKAYVATHPALVSLPRSTAPGMVEYRLPSADTIDVLFVHGRGRVAVEVKASNAAESDILRGLFQCVKYDALLRAELAIKGERPAARAVLVLEATLPEALVAARNTLGIDVVEGVVPTES